MTQGLIGQKAVMKCCLCRLLGCKAPTFFGKDGKMQPVEDGIMELFKERDEMNYERYRWYRVAEMLRKRLQQYEPLVQDLKDIEP